MLSCAEMVAGLNDAVNHSWSTDVSKRLEENRYIINLTFFADQTMVDDVLSRSLNGYFDGALKLAVTYANGQFDVNYLYVDTLMAPNFSTTNLEIVDKDKYDLKYILQKVIDAKSATPFIEIEEPATPQIKDDESTDSKKVDWLT